MIQLRGWWYPLVREEVTAKKVFIEGNGTPEQRGYGLKTVNPKRKIKVDTRTSAELLDEIEDRNREVDEVLEALRALIT